MAITLSERAAKKILKLMSRHKLPQTAYLRLGVKTGGCGGNSYFLDVTSEPAESDEVFESQGVRIVCDAKTLPLVDGTEIDYEDELLKGGFVFHNPNAHSSCGCGGSFSA